MSRCVTPRQAPGGSRTRDRATTHSPISKLSSPSAWNLESDLSKKDKIRRGEWREFPVEKGK